MEGLCVRHGLLDRWVSRIGSKKDHHEFVSMGGPTLVSRWVWQRLWVPFAVLGCLVVLVLAGVAATPERIGWLWLTKLSGHTRSELLWTYVICFGAAIWLYARTRRGLTGAMGLVVASILALTSTALGMATYRSCAPGSAPFFTPMAWTLALLVGNVEQPWSSGGACPTAAPLAIQLAQLTALGAVFTGVASLVVAFSRRQIDSFVARRAGRVVVVLGLDVDTGPVVRALAFELTPKTQLVVVDTTASPTIASEARSVGARLISLNTIDEHGLHEMLTRHGTLRATEIHLLGADLAKTMEAVRSVEAAVMHCAIPPTVSPRLVVRLDDPWVAEEWRRDHIGRDTPWLTDAVSAFEETARFVVAKAHAEGARNLVLVGRSHMSLAVLSEYARLGREAHVPGTGGKPIPEITLAGEDAIGLLADHRLAQSRFGDEGKLVVPQVRMTRASAETIAVLSDELEAAAVVLADIPTAAGLAVGSRLAAMRHHLTVLAWTSMSPGLPQEPVMGRLFPFGLSFLDSKGRPPVDNWTRLASLMHAAYVLGQENDSPSLKPWDQLPAFYRESNVRQLKCLLSAVTGLGRTWSAATPDDSTDIAFSERELAFLASVEHESWRGFYIQHGWRQSTRRDSERLRHPLLVPWDHLSDAVREGNTESIRTALALLAVLGYRPVGWQVFRRRGQVTAHLLKHSWTWIDESGSVLHAKVGDWRVTGSNGASWSVDAEVFAKTYGHIHGSSYVRRGLVKARPASAFEDADTLEGQSRAVAGSWLVEGEGGERWFVPDPTFRESYLAVDSSHTSLSSHEDEPDS